MAPKNKGLGRGLDALLATSQRNATKNDNKDDNLDFEESELQHLPIEFLQRGKYQPRKDMAPEALEELAASIRVQGIIQPIVVRSLAKNSFEIIAGERRWRAAQLAKLEKVPCLVKEIDDNAAIAMALIENIQREDLNVMEEAQALERLMNEFSLTHQQVAEAVGKSRTAVSNILRLNQLQTSVKLLVEHGDIDMGHARALLALDGEHQEEVAKQIAEQGLSVRQTEQLIKKLQSKPTTSEKTDNVSKGTDADVKRLSTNLSEKLGAPVKIAHNQRGKGKLTIEFSDLDQLDGILLQMGYQS